MAKNTTINIRVDAEIKDQAAAILASLGLSLSEAFNLMLHQVNLVRGLPFEVRQRLPIELNDGYGSYICKYGHIHNYSKFNFESVEDEIIDPNTKRYDNLDEMWADLNAEDADDKV
ncbi:MAG: type II toxin-antitoxin system RelB/DinJ family antitoxin [Firmicutes bacterium]|nr:type II toxin-antitoxin system RelB/DinJ family antitoxin [Bacillota bacterium]